MNTQTIPQLAPRDWEAVERAYIATKHYLVVDEILTEDACTRLRDALVSHWGWRKRDWIREHLYNAEPDIPEIRFLADELRAALPTVLGETVLTSHWALMYTKNSSGPIHVDLRGTTVNMWLTPDEYNLDPSGGGLLIWDRKAPVDAIPRDQDDHDWAHRYLDGATVERIPYRCNRAVLFDGRTFHQTDALAFRDAGPLSRRINLTMQFDTPENVEQRLSEFAAVVARKWEGGERTIERTDS